MICCVSGVVASGAVFFFFLMGWQVSLQSSLKGGTERRKTCHLRRSMLYLTINSHTHTHTLSLQTLCRPRTDCNPRNDIYNVAIQFLNVFFTYMATVSMPWRCTNFLHTVGWSCPHRENAPGHDLFGKVTDDVWFHVPLRKRIVILVFLLLNCLTQYANQVTRIIYYNYDLQNEFPGNMWTNIFFGLSMICAAIGGSLMGYHTGKIRATDPERFGLGPVELIREMYHKRFHREDSLESGPDAETHGVRPHRRRASEIARSEFDPTRASSRTSVIDVNRSSLRMFAL